MLKVTDVKTEIWKWIDLEKHFDWWAVTNYGTGYMRLMDELITQVDMEPL